jgi:hypothetical protein
MGRQNPTGNRNAMFDFTVIPKRDAWLLEDDQAGELGAYSTRDEALAAAGEWMRLIERPWPVLIQDADGEWREEIVAPTIVH